MTAPATDLTGPDPHSVRRPDPERIHAALGDGWRVTVTSPRPLSGEQYLSVLRWVRAIAAGFVSRPDVDDAEMGV